MESTIGLKIDEIVLNAVCGLCPCFSSYALMNEYEELWDSDIEFVIVRLYDRTKIENQYNSTETRFYILPEHEERLKAEIKRYHEALQKAQEEEAQKQIPYDASTYFYFHRVGTNIGVCHLSTIPVKKSRYLAQKALEEQEHENRMLSDPEYRKECEWHSQQYRPFCGAFESIEEYNRFRGIV